MTAGRHRRRRRSPADSGWPEQGICRGPGARGCQLRRAGRRGTRTSRGERRREVDPGQARLRGAEGRSRRGHVPRPAVQAARSGASPGGRGGRGFPGTAPVAGHDRHGEHLFRSGAACRPPDYLQAPDARPGSGALRQAPAARHQPDPAGARTVNRCQAAGSNRESARGRPGRRHLRRGDLRARAVRCGVALRPHPGARRGGQGDRVHLAPAGGD